MDPREKREMRRSGRSGVPWMTMVQLGCMHERVVALVLLGPAGYRWLHTGRLRS